MAPRKRPPKPPKDKLAPIDPDLVQAAELVPQAKASYRVSLGAIGAATTLTPQVIEAMCNLIAIGISIPRAAQAMGIPRDTWRAWNKKGSRDYAQGIPSNFAEWWERSNEAKASIEVTLISRIVQASLYDWKASAWIAERRWPERWQTPDKRPGKASDDDYASKSTAELKQLLEDAKAGKLLPSAKAESEDESDLDDDSEDDDSDYIESEVIDVVSTSVDQEQE